MAQFEQYEYKDANNCVGLAVLDPIQFTSAAAIGRTKSLNSLKNSKSPKMVNYDNVNCVNNFEAASSRKPTPPTLIFFSPKWAGRWMNAD